MGEIKKYMKGLFNGLNEIHKKNILHRDLKMDNIFIDENQEIVIGDFGKAKLLSWSKNSTDQFPLSLRPPEVLLLNGEYDTSTDIWCAGLILLEIDYSLQIQSASNL